MSIASSAPGPRLNPRALEQLQAAVAATRAAQLAAARALEALEACRHWLAAGCGSLAELGEHNGLAAAETRELLRVAQAIAKRPSLAADLRAGRLCLARVAVLRDVVLDPTLQIPGEDLVGQAMELSAQRVTRIVRRRLAERREGGPVVEVTVHLSGRGRDALERARTLLSRKDERLLCYSETVERSVSFLLDEIDPRRRRAGKRRLPHTRGVPGRAVPAEVDRALDLRFAGRCAVPRCDHMVWLQRAHLLAKARGGDQELENLILLCPRHHRMLDKGRIAIVGPPGARRFATRGGADLGPLDRPRGSAGPPK
jgi:hypothetical protein